VWLVRTAQAAGDLRRAEKVIAFAESLAADNPGVQPLAAIASHARGLLDGDDEKLRRAASAHPQPWSAASASEDAGFALGPHDPEAAKVWFDGALSAFEAIGATPDALRVRERLRCVGRRHGRRVERKVSGWASLTEAEQEVARYVAEGMTNRQVAERMYLSRHTVDFHLRAIFRKLVVASRVELTRVVLEHARRSTAATSAQQQGLGDPRTSCAVAVIRRSRGLGNANYDDDVRSGTAGTRRGGRR
jgi:DNA-binding CsgD family transcriptional regulator